MAEVIAFLERSSATAFAPLLVTSTTLPLPRLMFLMS